MQTKDEKRKNNNKKIYAKYNISVVVLDIERKEKEERLVCNKAVEKIWEIVRKHQC